MDYKNLYNQNLLDHYNHPRNKGSFKDANAKSGVYNPSCGDSIAIEAQIKDNIIIACKFQASGCVISSAGASVLVDKVIGLSIDQIMAFDKQTMLDLLQLKLGPTRLRCGLLPLEAVHNALKEYQKEK
ncbi:MAG: nitrogen fixation NifU-like protein [Alteromonas naphthalenivorans]|jgi:nitrogen fixation NifU-like protein